MPGQGRPHPLPPGATRLREGAGGASIALVNTASDLQRLKSWFDAGTLLDPASDGPTLVDFSRAVAALCGVGGLQLSEHAERLRQHVGPADHLVLLLIDGLGVEQIERFPRNGFLHPRSRIEMRSVFLSSTAPALTSLYTGEYPGRHGVLSWWLRLEEHGLDALPLRFEERFGEQPLVDLGVEPGDVLTVPSLIGRMKHRPVAILPRELVGSVYSTYSAGGTEQAGYGELPEAFAMVADRIAEAGEPTFTYVYLPQADSLAHAEGCDDGKVLECFAACDRLLVGLAQRLRGNARLLVTGDHGQVDVPDERTFFLEEADEIAALLSCPPSGEPAVPFFHVIPGQEQAFASAFRERWGEHFALLSRRESLELGCFGPGAPGKKALERMGQFLAIPGRPSTLRWRPTGAEVHVHRGEHGGLSRAEQTVPLFAF